MKILEGLKEVVDKIVLNGNHKDSALIGFSKCLTTNEHIYKNEVVTLCGCDKCNEYEKALNRLK